MHATLHILPARFLVASVPSAIATALLLIAAFLPWVAHAAVPTCSVSVTPNTLTPGQSAQLAWTMTDADRGAFSGGKTVSGSGSDTVRPDASRAYTLVVTNSSGARATCASQVTVRQALPQCSMSVNPAQILRGNSASLSWRSNGAIGATIAGIGSVDPSDSYIVSPSVTTQYRMTAQNASGSTSCVTTLTVIGPSTTTAAPQNRQGGQPRPITVVSPRSQLVNSTPVIIIDDPWYAWLEPVWAVPEFVYDEVFLPVWIPIEEYFGYADDAHDDYPGDTYKTGRDTGYQDSRTNDQGGSVRVTETETGTLYQSANMDPNDAGGVLHPREDASRLHETDREDYSGNDTQTHSLPQYQDARDNDQGSVQEPQTLPNQDAQNNDQGGGKWAFPTYDGTNPYQEYDI